MKIYKTSPIGPCLASGVAFVLLSLWAVLLLHPASVLAQDIISELRVIYGSSSSIRAPAGYTKVNVDLNRHAGGDYMYLCYKKGVGAPITGICVTVNSNRPPAGVVWTKIGVDLNRNAGGSYVYLWYTRDPSCEAIADIVVLINDARTPAGYTKINTDLNRHAGGSYLYFAYLKI